MFHNIYKKITCNYITIIIQSKIVISKFIYYYQFEIYFLIKKFQNLNIKILQYLKKQ